MEQSEIIKKIFAELSEAISSLSEEDFRKLSGEDYSISLRILRTRSKTAGGVELSMEEKQALIVDLEKADTREDGLQVLEDALSTKKLTEEFARFLDISVLKQDKLASIREKIVEATIGARLRSQAIQGKKT
jgi:hypothetical protein